MSDWDSIFGEAALGLDLAKVDPARTGSRQALAATSSAPAPAVQETRPAQSARSSLKLASRPKAPTASREAIFRTEALEFRVRGRNTPGGIVRLGARWIHWIYRILAVLVLVAVAAMWIIRTDESASGPAIVDGRTGTVAFLLPAVVGPDLASSQKFTVTLPGGGSVGISGLRAQLADDAAIRKARLVPLNQPAILVTAQLNPGAGAASVRQDEHVRTQASVMLRSESLADLLGRQFRAMFSNGSAP
ncbi:MAG TPA: hypothetical protein VFO01_08880 [Trebonia sp.]|nr:hypothetical protein [Trebonia sp.]